MAIGQVVPGLPGPLNDVAIEVIGIARPGDVLVLKFREHFRVDEIEAAIKAFRRQAPGVAILAFGPDADVEIRSSTEDQKWVGA